MGTAQIHCLGQIEAPKARVGRVLAVGIVAWRAAHATDSNKQEHYHYIAQPHFKAVKFRRVAKCGRRL